MDTLHTFIIKFQLKGSSFYPSLRKLILWTSFTDTQEVQHKYSRINSEHIHSRNSHIQQIHNSAKNKKSKNIFPKKQQISRSLMERAWASPECEALKAWFRLLTWSFFVGGFARAHDSELLIVEEMIRPPFLQTLSPALCSRLFTFISWTGGFLPFWCCVLSLCANTFSSRSEVVFYILLAFWE